MNSLNEIKKSLLMSLWFMFLTFPIMVVRVNTIEKEVTWRWHNLLLVAIAAFVLSFVWRYLLMRKDLGSQKKTQGQTITIATSLATLMWAMFFALVVFSTQVLKEKPLFDWDLNQVFFVILGCVILPARHYLEVFWRPWVEKIAGLLPEASAEHQGLDFSQRLLLDPKLKKGFYIFAMVVALVFPFASTMYQTSIMVTALTWVMLGLGLNIVVGLAGLLDLGYVAFYAVGAYSYALLNYHFGISFWMALPLGGAFGALFGIILGYPVLRLRGDYLAIVTLGFGEIIRLVLENWNDFSFGPSGIAQIPRPGIWGLKFNLSESIIFMYFIMIALTLFTIFIVNRLQDSRIGRAWVALREDEIACQAMGIDKRKTKLSAFAMGATWAGMAGVMFAAKTTFINPGSFTIWESVLILCIVVLGGMGSIFGVILGAFFLVLLPEYLRGMAEFRMLGFGTILVLMMVFRPGGVITAVRKTYTYKKAD